MTKKEFDIFDREIIEKLKVAKTTKITEIHVPHLTREQAESYVRDMINKHGGTVIDCGTTQDSQ